MDDRRPAGDRGSRPLRLGPLLGRPIPLRATVRRTLRERGLLDQGRRWLLACSGGPDSTAMVHALAALAAELRLTVEMASVDHGLRPESAAEVAAVGDLAESLGLPFHPLAVSLRSGKALQERARDARYEALQAARRARGLDVIAVGHTLDDQAETVLHRLLRGSGIAGLAGIAPHRDDGIVRPLIDVRRADVEAYLTHHELGAVRDPSNEDRRFTRVRLRTSLLPALEAEAPGAATRLAAAADDARVAREFIDQAAQRLLDEAGRPLRWAVLRDAHEAPRRRALSRYVARHAGAPPNRVQLEALDRLLFAPGEVWLSGGQAARREGEFLVIAPAVKRNGPSGRRMPRAPAARGARAEETMSANPPPESDD